MGTYILRRTKPRLRHVDRHLAGFRGGFAIDSAGGQVCKVKAFIATNEQEMAL